MTPLATLAALAALAALVLWRRGRASAESQRSTILRQFGRGEAYGQRATSATAWKTSPKRIIMFRHGEKSTAPRNGCAEDPDLDAAGIARARAFPTYFSVNLPGGLGPADTVVYAQAVRCACNSTRPIYTVVPLARALFGEVAEPVAVAASGGVIPDYEMLSGMNTVAAAGVFSKSRQFETRFPNTAHGRAALVDFIKTDPINNNKTVVICWEHDGLEHIIAGLFPAAPKIRYTDGNPFVDKNENVFDRTWVFDLGGSRVRFSAMRSWSAADSLVPLKYLSPLYVREFRR